MSRIHSFVFPIERTGFLAGNVATAKRRVKDFERLWEMLETGPTFAVEQIVFLAHIQEKMAR